MLTRNKYGQAVCQHCLSWHFAIYLGDDNKATNEIKCCSCGRLYNMIEGVVLTKDGIVEE